VCTWTCGGFLLTWPFFEEKTLDPEYGSMYCGLFRFFELDMFYLNLLHNMSYLSFWLLILWMITWKNTSRGVQVCYIDGFYTDSSNWKRWFWLYKIASPTGIFLLCLWHCNILMKLINLQKNAWFWLAVQLQLELYCPGKYCIELIRWSMNVIRCVVIYCGMELRLK
jgi:hypothetical protein